MSKFKLITLISGGILISSLAISISHTKTINTINTNQNNTILLSEHSSNISNQAVVINNNESPLVLYSDASSASSISSYISVGEMLTINSSKGDFYNVTVKETGATAYISKGEAKLIESGVNSTFSSLNQNGYIINVSSNVNLRKSATMDSNILCELKNNTNISILGQQGDWYKVNYNGQIGYLFGTYIGLGNTSTNAPYRSSSLTNPNINNNSNSTINAGNIVVILLHLLAL